MIPTNYGYFYSDLGVLVLSATELSASIPGARDSSTATVLFRSASQNGFGTPSTQTDSKQALRFLNCVSNPLTLTYPPVSAVAVVAVVLNVSIAAVPMIVEYFSIFFIFIPYSINKTY